MEVQTICQILEGDVICSITMSQVIGVMFLAGIGISITLYGIMETFDKFKTK